MTRGRKKKTFLENEVENISPTKEVFFERDKVLACPFCGEVSLELNGRDPTSSWCSKCGKCFPAIWKNVG